ncbi:MAG: nuclear transport factor 2 family protein [Ferruginibacter sp.]
MKDIIQQYLQYLQSGNLEKIYGLFSADAVVHSPLYGNISAMFFFERLFADTHQSGITLLNIFTNEDKAGLFAAHFRYHWILKNGAVTKFECVDIFQFNEGNKITELTIIYDTGKFRDDFEKMR